MPAFSMLTSVKSLSAIDTVALPGAPIVYAASGDNVTSTVSVHSGVVSFTGATVIVAEVAPAGMVNKPGSAA